MHINTAISILTLSAALALSPPALAQGLDIGADASVGGEDGINANVDASLGNAIVEADAQVGEDRSQLDADVNVGLGNGSGAGEVDGDASLTLGNGSASSDAASVYADLTLLGQGSDAAQVDALITLLDDPTLASVDLDAVINDEQIAIFDLGNLLGKEALAQVDAAIADGASGRDQIIADIQASTKLSSVLEQQGVALDSVIALRIGSIGATDVFVRAGAGEAAAAVAVGLNSAGSDSGGDDGSDGSGETPGGGVGNGPGSGNGKDANGGNGNGSNGGTANGSGSAGANGSGVVAGAGGGQVAIQVATLPCPAGLEAMIMASNANATSVLSASEISVIAVTGCPASQLPEAGNIAEIRATVGKDNEITSALSAQGLSAQDVIGASASGDTLVLYVNG